MRLARAAAVAILASALVGQGGKVAYADFGQKLLANLGEASPPPLPELLERHFARFLLAEFDMRVPKSMLDTNEGVTKVAAIAGALLDLQEHTVEWSAKDAAALKAERADLAALRKFITAWRSKPGKTDPPALAPRPSPCVLIFVPDRKTFVGMIGWLGLWKKIYQDFWWVDATAQFSDLRLQDEGQVQLIALEYAAAQANGDVIAGFDMNTRERTGMLQHVLQRAAVSWTWRWLGELCDTSFQLGLATSLVIDVLGQNNARSGGSGKSNTTQGQGGFIPGAPSQGGGMPVQNADSPWRHNLGQDYFARPLRQAQKNGEHGAESSKDKLGNFQLHDQSDQHKHLVTAPFLGRLALDREEVPAAFMDDYLEFHRGYRAAFVHWLQGNGMKTKAASAETFCLLVKRLIEGKQGADFDSVCKALYGVEVSAKEAGVDTLERRFLAWIANSLH